METTNARAGVTAGFTLIRVLALGVAASSAVIAVGYLIIAAIGPEVWWPSGGGTASGAFVPFPLPLRVLNAAAFALWWFTVLAMAFFVASLVDRIRDGVRFVPAVTRGAWSLAIALAVGSSLAQIASNIAGGSSLVLDN